MPCSIRCTVLPIAFCALAVAWENPGDGAAVEPCVNIAVVSQTFTDEGRTLRSVLEKLDEAALQRADLALLPQECVKTDGEAIPGPVSSALAAKARDHKMYVVGNIREKAGDATYVTSFLLDRDGKLVGRYRKSHKLPDETMDLGDELPVFNTDFGRVAMRIGADRYFPEIDLIYGERGARLILWSQMPEPVEDEHLQDFPSAGRAADFHVTIACARYASPSNVGYITNKFPPYRGCPIGRAYVVNCEGQRVASTSRMGGVATAAIPRSMLPQGRGLQRGKLSEAITAPVKLPENKPWKKRKVRVTAIESHLGVDALLQRLEEAGELGSDIACTYELVWFALRSKPDDKPDAERAARQAAAARENLRRVAEKARQHKMYVLIAGVIDRVERNEAILYDREGREAWRYFKVAKTHLDQIPGEEAPVFDTDFGRIAVRICADEWNVELDRSYAVQGADLLLTPTQSWGPDALFRNLRDISRAMDGLFYLVECTHSCTEARHRSIVADPAGVVVASSEYNRSGLVSAVVDLDQRPARYVREYTPHTPAGYLPQFQPAELPRVAHDLRETILRCRRPELYQQSAKESEPAPASRSSCSTLRPESLRIQQ